MKFNRVWAVYFSATGTTQKLVTAVADNLSQKFGVPCESFDFTLPEERKAPKRFEADDLVVFGTPVYAGRVPNVLLKYLLSLIHIFRYSGRKKRRRCLHRRRAWKL